MNVRHVFWVLFSMIQVLHGQSVQTESQVAKKKYVTQEIDNGIVTVDGVFDESVWELVEWDGDFTVHAPDNGAEPKERTKFKTLYDDSHLYIAFYCYHSNPSQLENRMGRRDDFPGDWIEINIDSYFDQNTGFSFSLSLSGVRGDEFITGNGNNWDSNWNPIWFGKTQIHDDGWTAEVKIPFSQLRFGNKQEHIWGINITRRDFGNDERSTWQYVPQNAAGWVSNFGELHGINNIKPKKQLEIQPYVVASYDSEETIEADPYRNGGTFKPSVGLDAKLGLTNDITVDLTINPDFGQVEADPSVLNLDGFQVFFDERRPFFVENANLFDNRLSRLDAGGPFGRDNLFYSRRIGAAPNGYPDIDNDAFTSRPQFTTILGAAKVSGKNKNGLSFGLLESITQKEHQKVNLNGQESLVTIEPLSNYLVGTVAQDFKQGETSIKGSFTSVNRTLENTGLEDLMHKSAYSGGLNVFHSWKEREWQLNMNLVGSQVSGTANKITDTQTSFEHYFQRPDAKNLSVDSTKTSLLGHGGTVSIGNYGGKDNISFQTGFTWRSKGLELNDLGFMRNADQMDNVTWVGWRLPKSTESLRSLRVNINAYNRWTTGGEYIYQAFNYNVHAGLKNFWSISTGLTFEARDRSPRALFGGPLLRQFSGLNPWIYVESDNRKKLVVGMDAFTFRPVGGDKGGVNVNGGSGFIRYQPGNAINFSIRPRYFRMDRSIQYVDEVTFQNDPQYIVSNVLQQTLSFETRINYSITANLTLQYYAQPFISRGQYTEFKHITDPLANKYYDRYALYSPSQIHPTEDNSEYQIDHNGDGLDDFTISNPDFNFIQFRSNFVLRWEYQPGSEFFAVWTQSTSNSTTDFSDGIGSSLFSGLTDEFVDNIFLLKFTYRFY